MLANNASASGNGELGFGCGGLGGGHGGDGFGCGGLGGGRGGDFGVLRPAYVRLPNAGNDLCAAAVDTNWHASQEMTDDRNLSTAAVGQSWLALEHTPQGMTGDHDLCTAAVDTSCLGLGLAQTWPALDRASQECGGNGNGNGQLGAKAGGGDGDGGGDGVAGVLQRKRAKRNQEKAEWRRRQAAARRAAFEAEHASYWPSHPRI